MNYALRNRGKKQKHRKSHIPKCNSHILLMSLIVSLENIELVVNALSKSISKFNELFFVL